MPSQADKTKDMSLLQLAESYCKQSLFLVNRIDRPASGIVLMGKRKEVQTFYLEPKNTISKEYLAVVKKGVEQAQAELHHYLAKKNSKAIISEKEHKEFKSSKLSYIKLGALDNFDVLKVKLQSGRFHQIRAQLAHIGHPIKGDVKYGARRGNKNRSIHLHAHKLSIKHPTTKQTMTFEAPLDISDVIWANVAELVQ